jgi:hypothetical protein
MLLDHYIWFRTSPACLVVRKWFSSCFLTGLYQRPFRILWTHPVIQGGSLLSFGSRTELCQCPIISYWTHSVNLETLLDSDQTPLECVRTVEEHVWSMA